MAILTSAKGTRRAKRIADVDFRYDVSASLPDGGKPDQWTHFSLRVEAEDGRRYRLILDFDEAKRVVDYFGEQIRKGCN